MRSSGKQTKQMKILLNLARLLQRLRFDFERYGEKRGSLFSYIWVRTEFRLSFNYKAESFQELLFVREENSLEMGILEEEGLERD